MKWRDVKDSPVVPLGEKRPHDTHTHTHTHTQRLVEQPLLNKTIEYSKQCVPGLSHCKPDTLGCPWTQTLACPQDTFLSQRLATKYVVKLFEHL
jgi:hypothetical protein